MSSVLFGRQMTGGGNVFRVVYVKSKTVVFAGDTATGWRERNT